MHAHQREEDEATSKRKREELKNKVRAANGIIHSLKEKLADANTSVRSPASPSLRRGWSGSSDMSARLLRSRSGGLLSVFVLAAADRAELPCTLSAGVEGVALPCRPCLL